MKIIVDAMGGDNAPGEIIKGAFEAYREYGKNGIEITLVGDEDVMKRIAEEQKTDLSVFKIVHTDCVLTMEDDPLSVIHTKKGASVCVALRMLADGEGDAVVSAGNTGALFTAASLIVRRMPGIQRAAIAGILPMQPPLLLLDAGANVTVTDEYLEKFALLGSAYMKMVYKVDEPRVGLLNNGAEECKGTQLQVDTYKRLQENTNINFVGNIESDRIPFNVCDVLVTDGFTGNILLKSVEGMGKLMISTMKGIYTDNVMAKFSSLFVYDKLKEIKKNFSSEEHGGAPILGLRKPVIKAHGSSSARAIKNAIRQAINYAEADVIGNVEKEIKSINDMKKRGS